jgi:hypothetical protein
VFHPRIRLTRFHGVFAPNSKHRAEITPAKRGKGKPASSRKEGEAKTPAESRAAMTWAQRLKRVFNIDIQTCRDCQGPVKIIAAIEDPDVIHKILTHRKEKVPAPQPARLPVCRAPPPRLV